MSGKRRGERPENMTALRRLRARLDDIDRRHPELSTCSPTADNRAEWRIYMEARVSDRKPTSVRLPAELEARLDALVPRLAARPDLRAAGRLSRATALRLAVLRGIESLEAELPPAEPHDVASP